MSALPRPAPSRPESLRLSLSALDAARGVTAFVLADVDGFAIASDADDDLAERVAAWAPARLAGELAGLLEGGEPVSVRAVRLGEGDDELVSLSAVGRPDRCAAFLDAAAGLVREAYLRRA